MHSVLIRPISSAQGAADSGATKRSLMQALSPARDGILVCGVRLAQGGAVVVETTCEASALKNWVVAVCPELHERVSKEGHLWVGWRRCVVHSVNWVTMCFRCQCYGHMAKHCRDSQETCGHCASKGHRTGTCPAKVAGVVPVCAACRRTGRRGDHDLFCRQCPSYVAALVRQMSRTKSKSKTTTQTTTVGTTNNDNGQTKQT